MSYKFLANLSAILFASPGVKSDSWMIVGIFSERAAMTQERLRIRPLKIINQVYVLEFYVHLTRLLIL